MRATGINKRAKKIHHLFINCLQTNGDYASKREEKTMRQLHFFRVESFPAQTRSLGCGDGQITINQSTLNRQTARMLFPGLCDDFFKLMNKLQKPFVERRNLSKAKFSSVRAIGIKNRLNPFFQVFRMARESFLTFGRTVRENLTSKICSYVSRS